MKIFFRHRPKRSKMMFFIKGFAKLSLREGRRTMFIAEQSMYGNINFSNFFVFVLVQVGMLLKIYVAD